VAPLMAEALKLPEPEPGPSPQDEDEAAWDAWSEARDELRKQCTAVASGEAPLHAMPLPCRKALDEGREVMQGVLAVTHAEKGGLPVGAGSLSRPDFPFQPRGMRALERVLELAALEMRVLLAEGRGEEAVNLCLDAMALSRELSLGGGLHGSKLAASSLELVYRPCAAALDAASVERKRQALAQLALLGQGWAPPSRLLREELVYHQLVTFGPEMLPPEALAQLPPAGRALVASRGGWFFYTSWIGHPATAWISHPTSRRYLWHRNVSLFDDMVAMADLPADERKRAFARIDSAHGFLAGYPGAAQALEYHRDLEHIELRWLHLTSLSALVEADIARAEQGHWPAALSEAAKGWTVVPISEREARLVPTDVRAAGNFLSITADSVP
jgi:hypothetical protein